MTDARAAVYFEPDGFDTSREKLMGRHVAGESFLAAMARHTAARELIAVAPTAEHFADFEARVRAASASAPGTRWIPSSEPDALSEVGCLFYPGLPPGRWAWVRRRGGQRRFSLCGVTHTTASERAMATIGEMLVAPFQCWDALVCTSRAVRDMVARLLDEYGEYLTERTAGRGVRHPQLPIIPLGVDCSALEPTEAARTRGAALRERIRIPADAFVVLFVGRLSYHGKAHPMPLYLALERASRRFSQPLCLLLAGWFANDSIQKQFVEGARRYCPSVRLVAVDGRLPEIRRDVWHAADAFASPSDNIQETFGLTPVEAMAAGLPTVISDWDGYRDGPAHGIEGFLVPTWLAPPGSGEEIARRHHQGIDDYDHYIGHAGQFAAVEVAPMQRAFETLLEDPARRREMGARARRRACEVYDWPVVIRQYEALWAELAELRQRGEESAPPEPSRPPAPLHADPFALFAGYPSCVLDGETRVAASPDLATDAIGERTGLFMNQLADVLLCDPGTRDRLLHEIGQRGEWRCDELLEALVPADADAVRRTLVWLAKLDIVRLRNPGRA